MKKKLLLLSCLFTIGIVSAQESQKRIGIGTALPDPSAILHIESTDKGVLIPNVVIEDLTAKDPIKGEIKESLLVFNTGSASAPKGYYYWTATVSGTNKWVRVITSEDTSEILGGQVQELYEIKETTFDAYEVDDATGEIVMENGAPKTKPVTIEALVVYAPDKTKPTVGKVELDVPAVVKKTQSLTSFGLTQKTYYKYFDTVNDKEVILEKALTPTEITDLEYEPLGNSTEIFMEYLDESGKLNLFSVKDLLGSDNVDVPAITNLVVNPGKTGLIFTNEKGVTQDVDIADIVDKTQTNTSMTVDNQGYLVYTNERKTTDKINLRAAVKEPWYVAQTGEEAVSNKEDVFVEGWAGIGLTPAEAKAAVENLKTDEKLRVNGSIYARNSYYADYVFENYFTKESSSLKYDYSFKDLSTVESFIKENYHLPGITPVAELDKSSEEGYLINVSELSIQLLEKVEELYLHTIDQNKLIQQQEAQLKMQEERLQAIEMYLKQVK